MNIKAQITAAQSAYVTKKIDKEYFTAVGNPENLLKLLRVVEEARVVCDLVDDDERLESLRGLVTAFEANPTDKGV